MGKSISEKYLPLPVAKKNFGGQIITNSAALKQLYLEMYQHRLRHRPIKSGFDELKSFLKNFDCTKT